MSESVKLGAGLVAAIAAGGIAQGFDNTSSAHEQVSDTQAKVTHEIKTQKPTSVLQGGEATVTLQDGRKFKINSPPIVHSDPEGEHDHTIVMDGEANPKTGDLVTGYYGERGGTSDHEKAASITYSEDGQSFGADEALKSSIKERVSEEAGHLVVAASQPHAGEDVGQAVMITPATPPHK